MSRKINLVNGNIITLEESCPIAETISINNGKIAGINAIDANFKSIDLQGATVIPGFVDAHFHLVNLGKQTDSLNLKNCKSSHEIADKVLQKSKKLDFDEFILGFGWDHNKWDNKIFPDSDILNNLHVSQPIILTRIDGHSYWVNQKAMQLSGLDVSLEPPKGGNIINDCILIDNAMQPVQAIIPKPSEKNVERWIE
ncbi:uncharacterized protein METZ01_LOCUS500861, partial [marine metagenome]